MIYLCKYRIEKEIESMTRSQIIRDIAQDNITIESALQRLLVISYTLNNLELQHWIESELNGYTADSILPDYRKKVTYMIRYTGFNANTLVKRQPLPESYFGDELQEILKSRVIKDGVNIIEDTIKNESEVSFNLIDCAGIISNNSDGMIRCVSLEQIISKTTFLQIISNVKTKLILILLDLEKEFGSLDNLDIDVTVKSNEELKEVNNKLTNKLYFNGKSEIL